MPPPSASDAKPGVIRLRPVTTLVLGTDLAYRERALAVLGELGPVMFAGIAMAAADEVADVVALVGEERPDVVLVDATDREDGAARVIVALAEASAAVGVVVVCDRSTAGARRLGALPKWGWTQDLLSAVRAAHAAGSPCAPEGVMARDTPRPAGPLSGWAQDGPPAPAA